MAKKKIDITQPVIKDEDVQVTKPVKTKRNIFVDPVQPETFDEPELEKTESESTRPIKQNRSVFRTSEPMKEPDFTAKPPAEEPKTKKSGRGKWVWLGILMMLLITAAGVGIGYSAAMRVRKAEENNQKLIAATTQYELALQEQAAGQLGMAQKRLEYVIGIYPQFPGVDQKLAEVMLARGLAQQVTPQPATTSQSVITPVATVDTKQMSVLLNQAQNQYKTANQAQLQYRNSGTYEDKMVANQCWADLLISVESMRDIDPTYEPFIVDGLYYYALLYNGMAKIDNGHLEVGIYYLRMAQEFGPIGLDAWNKSELAKAYLLAGSWYGVNWYQAADLFNQLVSNAPNLFDSSDMTTKMRWQKTQIGIGDTLMSEGKYCEAFTQYNASAGYDTSEEFQAKLVQAQQYCETPPATPTPTVDPNATPTATPEG